MVTVRQAAVAGQFYPSSPAALKKQIESFSDKIKTTVVKEQAIACILPHAGYMYSGAVAYSVASQLEIKENIIILGPNHTGRGEPFSLMAEGMWSTPFGNVSIHSSLAKKLAGKIPFLKSDSSAHQAEHSIEVELPMLQYFKSDFTFVPITLASNDVAKLQRLGKGIADVILDMGIEKQTLIVASSDMTHYEDNSSAKVKDAQALRAIAELDEAALWEKIQELGITMCGYAPVITMISAAKALGAKKGRVVTYQTSGDVTGDNSSVVGYAGVIVS